MPQHYSPGGSRHRTVNVRAVAFITTEYSQSGSTLQCVSGRGLVCLGLFITRFRIVSAGGYCCWARHIVVLSVRPSVFMSVFRLSVGTSRKMVQFTQTSSVAVGFGRHGIPRPSVTLTFDCLTLKVETGMQVTSKIGNLLLGTLGLCILELFAVYATDGQTERRTDGRTKATLIASFPTVGGIIKTFLNGPFIAPRYTLKIERSKLRYDRSALGRAHLPPTTVFRTSKPRVAASTGPQYQYVDGIFPT